MPHLLGLTLLFTQAAHALPSVDDPLPTGASAPHDAAVVIGIEDYFVLPDVPYARRDAAAVREFLLVTRGVPRDHVQLLDGAPVKEQILDAVTTAAGLAGTGGTVWVYFAGHGAASPTTGERLWLGADVQADLAVFDARSVPLSVVQQTAGSQGANVVLLSDACYSGQARGGSWRGPEAPSGSTSPGMGRPPPPPASACGWARTSSRI